MTKETKKTKDTKSIKEENENKVGLSKKEIYDIEKMKKDSLKKKINSKNKSKKKHMYNLPVRVAVLIMLILMVGSVIAAFATYFAK